jgi:RNA polymerase sigma factor (TIGR02999 family)
MSERAVAFLSLFSGAAIQRFAKSAPHMEKRKRREMSNSAPASRAQSRSMNDADVTSLLRKWSEGDRDAEESLWPRVFAELKRLARRHLAHQRPGHTLETGALLNEVYLRFANLENAHWENRGKFFALCAQMMRQILIDHARARDSQKRGGYAVKVPLSDVALVSESKAIELLALDDALKRLAKIHRRKSQVVEMRFFGGLSMEEIAEALNVSTLTVIRDWNFARAWLQAVMNGERIDER